MLDKKELPSQVELKNGNLCVRFVYTNTNSFVGHELMNGFYRSMCLVQITTIGTYLYYFNISYFKHYE